MTIRKKLILLLVSIAIVSGITAPSYSVYEDWVESEDLAVNDAESTGKVIAFAIASWYEHAPYDSGNDAQAHINYFVLYLHEQLNEDIEFLDMNKKIIGDAVIEDVGTIFNEDRNDEVGQTLRDGITRTFIEISDDYPHGIKQIVMQVKAKGGEPIGALIFEYTSYYNRYIAEAKRGTLYSSLVIIISLLIVSAIGYRAATIISKPISDLKEASDAIASGNLDIDVEIESKDEIGDLAAAFISMAALRKKADDALRSSEEKFRMVTECAGDAVIGLKSPGIIFLWNKKAAEMFGYAENEVN